MFDLCLLHAQPPAPILRTDQDDQWPEQRAGTPATQHQHHKTTNNKNNNASNNEIYNKRKQRPKNDKNERTG
jgi:hypothetical protein